MFCNDFDSSSFSCTYRRIKSEVNLSRRLPNTSTFVPNDHWQCLYSVLPIMRCAFAAHLDVSFAERPTPRRFVGTGHVSFPCFRAQEDGHLWSDRIAYIMSHLPLLERVMSPKDSFHGCHDVTIGSVSLQCRKHLFIFYTLIHEESPWAFPE